MQAEMADEASFFWVKYGFENVTPLKMYNANVSCAILLSFVKNTCARDIEDYCKQKNIQLGIELDALDRLLLGTQGGTGAVPGVTSARSMKSGSRPTSRGLSSRTLHTDADATTTAHQDDRALQEEIAEARAKKAANESQLQVIATAAKLAKELLAGTATVDLVDEHGTRLMLDEAGGARANTIVTSRAEYAAVALTTDEKGATRVVSLIFKLHKSPTDATPNADLPEAEA